MEQQEQQNLGLTNYFDGLMKVPYLKNLWIALYGPLTKKEKKANGRLLDSYTWQATPFNLLSPKLRQELCKELIKSDEMFAEDSSLRDEFYNRIYDVLNLLLSDTTRSIVIPILQQPQECVPNTREFSLLPEALMSEIFLWHQCGLPVSLREKHLLQRCLRQFLPNKPRGASGTARAYREKDAALLKEQKALLRQLDHYIKLLDKKDTEPTGTKESKEDQKVISDKKLLKLNDRILSLIIDSALRHSYTILNGNFKLLEDVLKEKK